MGCCFSSSNKGLQSGEPDERTTLLPNPVSNTPYSSTEDYRPECDRPHNQVGDGQAAWSRILHQTACNIIDVSAIHTHLEQKEYVDRVKLYKKRIDSTPWKHPGKENKLLLKDLPYPEKVLSTNPICLTDLKQVNDACENVIKALEEVRVEHKEDLVAHFGVS